MTPTARFFAAASAAIAIGSLPPAKAAEITPASDPLCTWQLSGPFAEGDIDRLGPALGDLGEARLCLDSPGGPLPVTVALAEYLFAEGIGTAVGDGMTCAGSCGLVFMAGIFLGMDYPAPNRVLGLGGTLGVAFPPAEVAVDQDEVLTAVGRLLDLGRYGRGLSPQIPASLLAMVMRAAPDSPILIDTIDEARRWNIQVGPNEIVSRDGLPTAPPQPAIDRFTAARICNSQEARRADRPTRPRGAGREMVFDTPKYQETDQQRAWLFDEDPLFCTVFTGQESGICIGQRDLDGCEDIATAPSRTLDFLDLLDPSTKLWMLEAADDRTDILLRTFKSFWRRDGAVFGLEGGPNDTVLYRLYGEPGGFGVPGTAVAWLTADAGGWRGVIDLAPQCGGLAADTNGTISTDGRQLMLSGNGFAEGGDCLTAERSVDYEQTYELITTADDPRARDLLTEAIRNRGR